MSLPVSSNFGYKVAYEGASIHDALLTEAGKVTDDPAVDTDIANKKYVDDNTTPPGGSNSQVQYNDNGAFAGSSLFTFDPTAVSNSGAITLAYHLGPSAPPLGQWGVVGDTAATGNAPLFNVAAGNATAGIGGELRLASGAGTPDGEINIQTPGATTGNGADITITAGQSANGTGGAVVVKTNDSTGQTTGAISLTTGDGANGGAVTISTGAGTAAGGNITISGGTGSKNAGGSTTITGGESASLTAAGGGVTIGGGNNTSLGAGGGINIVAGANTGTGVGGSASLSAGSSASAAAAGNVSITAGANSSSGTGGLLEMFGGSAQTGTGGAVTITGGAATGASAAGGVTITGGANTGTGNGGGVTITGGANEDNLGSNVTITPGSSTNDYPGLVNIPASVHLGSIMITNTSLTVVYQGIDVYAQGSTKLFPLGTKLYQEGKIYRYVYLETINQVTGRLVRTIAGGAFDHLGTATGNYTHAGTVTSTWQGPVNLTVANDPRVVEGSLFYLQNGQGTQRIRSHSAANIGATILYGVDDGITGAAPSGSIAGGCYFFSSRYVVVQSQNDSGSPNQDQVGAMVRTNASANQFLWVQSGGDCLLICGPSPISQGALLCNASTGGTSGRVIAATAVNQQIVGRARQNGTTGNWFCANLTIDN